METTIAIVSLIIGVAGFSVAIWQARLSKEQVRIAKQQATIPQPSTIVYGLSASKLSIDDSVVGKWEGKSFDNRPLVKGARRAKYLHIEQFAITSHDDRVTITGRSIYPNTLETASRWSGGLWKIGDDETLYFGIELNHRGTLEFGTLTVTVQGNEAEGYYYSGAPGTEYISSYKAKKVIDFAPTEPR